MSRRTEQTKRATAARHSAIEQLIARHPNEFQNLLAVERATVGLAPRHARWLRQDITKDEIGERAYNAARRAGLHKVRDIRRATDDELMVGRAFGATSLRIIRQVYGWHDNRRATTAIRADRPKCGTTAGWNWHVNSGELPCESCEDAKLTAKRRAVQS